MLSASGFGRAGPPGAAGFGKTRCGKDQSSFSPLMFASKVARDDAGASASGHSALSQAAKLCSTARL